MRGWDGFKNPSNFSLKNSSKSLIINIKEFMFRSQGDPLLDVMGTAWQSHPKETKRLLKRLTKLGVTINVSESDSIGYTPSLQSVGGPGVLNLPFNYSYGAILHEADHVFEDMKAKWNGWNVIFYELKERIRRERQVYTLEIKLASEMGFHDVVKQLKRNLEDEIEKIKTEAINNIKDSGPDWRKRRRTILAYR